MVKRGARHLSARYRIVRSTKKDPWGRSIFIRRKPFLKSLRAYFLRIKNMRKKRNFKNVLLLDKSRGFMKKRTSRNSQYGRVLRNKQLIKKFYATLKEKQMR